MICHDLDKGIMVNHDLARLTMTMASVPLLRTLGKAPILDLSVAVFSEKVFVSQKGSRFALTKQNPNYEIECAVFLNQAIRKIKGI